jgi:Tol biopolymer transport system component
VSAIYVLTLGSASAVPTRVLGGKGTASRSEHDLAWSPDGNNLAFLSDREKPGQLQLYVADDRGAAATKLTSLNGALAMPRWSPAGKLLALLFTASAGAAPGPLQPRIVETGVIEEHINEQRLIIGDATSGRVPRRVGTERCDLKRIVAFLARPCPQQRLGPVRQVRGSPRSRS